MDETVDARELENERLQAEFLLRVLNDDDDDDQASKWGENDAKRALKLSRDDSD